MTLSPHKLSGIIGWIANEVILISNILNMCRETNDSA